LDNPLEFGLQSDLDRAKSVRVNQPEPAPMDYPITHIP
jgi:hypothetical protein